MTRAVRLLVRFFRLAGTVLVALCVATIVLVATQNFDSAELSADFLVMWMAAVMLCLAGAAWTTADPQMRGTRTAAWMRYGAYLGTLIVLIPFAAMRSRYLGPPSFDMIACGLAGFAAADAIGAWTSPNGMPPRATSGGAEASARTPAFAGFSMWLVVRIAFLGTGAALVLLFTALPLLQRVLLVDPSTIEAPGALATAMTCAAATAAMGALVALLPSRYRTRPRARRARAALYLALGAVLLAVLFTPSTRIGGLLGGACALVVAASIALDLVLEATVPPSRARPRRATLRRALLFAVKMFGYKRWALNAALPAFLTIAALLFVSFVPALIRSGARGRPDLLAPFAAWIAAATALAWIGGGVVRRWPAVAAVLPLAAYGRMVTPRWLAVACVSLAVVVRRAQIVDVAVGHPVHGDAFGIALGTAVAATGILAGGYQAATLVAYLPDLRAMPPMRRHIRRVLAGAHWLRRIAKPRSVTSLTEDETA